MLWARGRKMSIHASRRYLFWVGGAMLTLALGMGLGAHTVFASLLVNGAPQKASEFRDSNPAPNPNQPLATNTFTVTSTPTITRTPTITLTPTATPNCPQNYNITQLSSGTVVSGTTLLAGSQCDDCSASVTLPFTYTFYGQNFTTANVISNGAIAFSTPVDTSFTNYCLPDPNPSSNILFAYWRDLTMDTADELRCVDIGCGVYTSISGSAPNRIFNIEYRALSLSATNPFTP